MINKIIVKFGSFFEPKVIRIKLINVKLLHVTTPFLSSCHLTNLNTRNKPMINLAVNKNQYFRYFSINNFKKIVTEFI